MADLEAWRKSLRGQDREVHTPNQPQQEQRLQSHRPLRGRRGYFERVEEPPLEVDDSEDYNIKIEDYENGFRHFWHNVFANVGRPVY